MFEKKIKLIPYGKQCINDADIEAVVHALRDEYLTQGPKIEEFEKAFASYVGVSYALAVSNGTTALHLCALALKVNETTRVITTPITFVASANCILYCGGTVDLCDVNPSSFLLDLDKLEKKLASNPKGFYSGIVAVDFAGYPVDLERLRKIADANSLWIIEDACHSPGGFFLNSSNKIEKCGNGKHADLAVFSFHPVKHITTGEGGMITTNSLELYNKLKLLRTHGITREKNRLKEDHGGWYYEMQELGYNYRLTDFQSALGISQLKHATDRLNVRKEIAKKYWSFFKDKDYIITQSGYVVGHAYHLYIILTKGRLELYNYLKNKSIYCQVHYIPIHLMPYYQTLGWKTGDFPNAEYYYEHCLSLPMFPTLSDDEQQFVMATINEHFSHD
ncbi:MAG: UDP-4-amino-4,6-dideoxy-N-acetyl-beta-L-altrosamine transaminase [Bacteroidota bacterium]